MKTKIGAVLLSIMAILSLQSKIYAVDSSKDVSNHDSQHIPTQSLILDETDLEHTYSEPDLSSKEYQTIFKYPIAEDPLEFYSEKLN